MISTHALDLGSGHPARGLDVALDVLEPDGTWSRAGVGTTNDDGRVASLADAASLAGRTVRLRFETGTYFASASQRAFFPFVDVVFVVEAGLSRLHVPLLVSPFGYSTYRGS
jgi:5-hydroxyisourate hydrolase